MKEDSDLRYWKKQIGAAGLAALLVWVAAARADTATTQKTTKSQALSTRKKTATAHRRRSVAATPKRKSGGAGTKPATAATPKKPATSTAAKSKRTAGGAGPKSQGAATQKKPATSTAAKSTSGGQPTQKSATRTGQRSSQHHASSHHLSAKAKLAAARRRRAQLHPAPERITEIQKALIEAGYPDVQPTGQWDDTTRDAMRRYQLANGFPTTGLPEAKSLMKLGLGPHPLPSDLDTNASKPGGETTAAPAAPAEGSKQ